MVKKTVSIIVAIYNGEKYLQSCLDSIRAQSYCDIEVLMIDDGSTDSSGDICDRFADLDRRFKAIHQQNKGCSSARNHGLALASGEYIAIVDQDDFLHRDYISYFMNMIASYDLEIATSNTLCRFIGEPNPLPIDLEDKKIILSGDEAAKSMLLYKFQIGPWNKVIKKSLIESNNIRFQEDFFCGEGFAFSIECFQAAKKVAVGTQKVYYYRIDNANSGTSSFSEKKYRSSVEAQKYMRSILNDKSLYADRVLRYSMWRTVSDFYTLIRMSRSEKKYPEVFSEICKNVRKDAYLAFRLPIARKAKLDALKYIISPYFTFLLKKRRIDKTTGGKFKRK